MENDQRQINHWVDKASIIPIEKVKKWSLRFLSVIVLVDIGSVVTAIALIVYIVSLKNGSAENKELASVIDSATSLFVVLHIAMLFICIIPVSKWIYRTYNNVGAITRAHLQRNPGWVVASFFVPFAFLFVPYQAMKEVCEAINNHWKGDHPSMAVVNSGALNDRVYGWWMLWILGSILSRIHSKLSPETIDGFLGQALFGLVIDIMSIGAGLLLINVIRELSLIQNQRLSESGTSTEKVA